MYTYILINNCILMLWINQTQTMFSCDAPYQKRSVTARHCSDNPTPWLQARARKNGSIHCQDRSDCVCNNERKEDNRQNNIQNKYITDDNVCVMYSLVSGYCTYIVYYLSVCHSVPFYEKACKVLL